MLFPNVSCWSHAISQLIWSPHALLPWRSWPSPAPRLQHLGPLTPGPPLMEWEVIYHIYIYILIYLFIHHYIILHSFISSFIIIYHYTILWDGNYIKYPPYFRIFNYWLDSIVYNSLHFLISRFPANPMTIPWIFWLLLWDAVSPRTGPMTKMRMFDRAQREKRHAREALAAQWAN